MKSVDKFEWRLPTGAAVGATLVLLAFFLVGTDADSDLLYILFIGPLVLLIFVVLLIAAIIRRKPLQSLSVILTFIAFAGTSVGMLKNERSVRPWFRWLLRSSQFKSQVLTQVAPTNGELRHIKWDGWGGAPVGDWTAYVVFDPDDSLLMAAKNHSSGRFSGIPCDVDEVRRLENHWYSVTFSMNEWWRPGC